MNNPFTVAEFRDRIAAIVNPNRSLYRTSRDVRGCDGCAESMLSTALRIAADGRHYCAVCLEGGSEIAKGEL